jgi:hypothetical protein
MRRRQGIFNMQVHAIMQALIVVPNAQAECSSPSLVANGTDLTRPGLLQGADFRLSETIHALAVLLGCLTCFLPASEVPGCGQVAQPNLLTDRTPRMSLFRRLSDH